ncbi:hypothetical protein Lal_00038050 [Lupinus albus]|nr:hypothetical protein Lal_00038050 [Lupinus albus]
MVGNASLYWDQATSAARERGIPWASVFGNHDDAQFEWPLEWFSLPGIPQIQCPPTTTSYSGEECNFKGIGRLELMKNEMEKNASFSSHGPRNLWPSVSNYVLQVSSPGDLHSPVAFLYFLDSGGGSYPEVVSSQQAEWFLQKAEEINSDSRVPEIIFWHIPSTAYKVVAPKSSIQKPCVGSINKESVASQEAEMGIMDLLANRTSVKVMSTLMPCVYKRCPMLLYKASKGAFSPTKLSSHIGGHLIDKFDLSRLEFAISHMRSIKRLTQYLLDTTMDWIGAAHTRNYGYAMLGTLAMEAMEIGLEDLEF